jgi:hypothetical protein
MGNLNIIGQEFRNYVANQIMVRQETHGSGTDSLRNNDQISYLNSKTAWIKLASSVEITEEKLKKMYLSSSLKGAALARNNILFGGVSYLPTKLRDDGKTKYLIGEISPQPSNVGLSGYQHSNDYGTVPMPGIESVDVKTLNRGSLEKATVKLKAYSREQFDIIDVLYLRLGYTVVLEFGNSNFINNKGKFDTVKNTFIDSATGFFSKTPKSFKNILNAVEDFRGKYDGNYDALVGKITNFNWDFNPDGSYDITITIISMGDVIESLKSNVSPSKDALTFINDTNKSSGESDQDFAPISDNISSMLWIWQFINRKILENSNQTPVSITLNSGRAEENKNFIGKICSSGQNEIQSKIYDYYIYLGTSWPGVDSNDSTLFISKNNPVDPEAVKKEIEDKIKNDKKNLNNFPGSNNIDKKFYEKYSYQQTTSYRIKTIGGDFKDKTVTSPVQVNPLPKVYKQSRNGILVDNILKSSATAKSCFVLRGKAGKDGESPKNIFYLRFGTLLRFLQKNIIPAIKASNGNTPLFDIGWHGYTEYKMYSLPNHISLDPRVCLVRNDEFQKRTNSFAKVLPQLLPFRVQDYSPGKYPNAAYVLNIYLNFDFIQSCISDNTDEMGNVGIFGFISSICSGLNKALGGINNLEPVIDKLTNVLKIIDSTPIPGVTKSQNNTYALELYGYNNNTSNFVRKVDLKTAITKEYSTMITVGATAGGYVKGSDATAFSNWNSGLVDRFNKKLINNVTEGTNENEAKDNYEQSFLNQLSKCYGFNGIFKGKQGKDVSIDTKAIKKNLSIVTEYYKWLNNKNKKGNSIGFIPFKLSLTLDGISGIRIYDKLRIDSRFLPSNYGTELDLIVTGITNKLSNNDWETSIQTTVIPRAGADIPAPEVPEIVEKTPALGNQQKRAQAKYGKPKQAGGPDFKLVKFDTPYPLFYEGSMVKNDQKLQPTAGGKKVAVKFSNLTYDYTTKLWTDVSGKHGKAGATYKHNKKVDGPRTFKVHELEKDSIEKCYTEIANAYTLEEIYKLGLNCCSGLYNARNIRGGNTWSMHSWGTAIDILASRGVLKSKERYGSSKSNPPAAFTKPEYKKFLDIMESNGWYSLGRRADYDWMHFQTTPF